MKQYDSFKEEMASILSSLEEEERDRISASLARPEDEIDLLEQKYDRSIRNRAAVHSLLKKTSEDLIQRYQTIFEYSGTAMAVIDHDGTITLVNSNFEKFFGFARDEVENKMKFPQLVDESMKERMIGFHARRLAGERDVPHFYESRVINKEGQIRDISITVGLFPASGQIIVSITDITERKKAEEAVRRANEKMTILNSLTRHDIINQLTPLFMRLELAWRIPKTLN